ncbi:thermonuclease family protein [Bordetella genomosp. 9]|uniref:thermonuclease family protein n=1 Tax=Bordetella genomosp. 9 TaxID=1416803 RepID=UPI003B27DAAC
MRAVLRRAGVSRPVIALVAALAAAGLGYCASPSGRAPAHGQGYTLEGRIVHVADGDTVTLLAREGQRRIRLASIDAPETGHGREKPGQPYAQAARRNLESLVAGRTLTARCYEQDRYGRDVCDLPLQDGQTANRRQVADGYAWANTVRRGEYLRDPSLPGLQREAEQARRGLWAQPHAVPPWVWRHDCWNEGKCAAAAQAR